MKPAVQKRKVDFAALSQWVEPKARLLDLGCGRGIILSDLHHAKETYGVGVDIDPDKILGCVKRGIPAYQGDIEAILREFPDRFFDWVICSRTLPELAQPARVLDEALRVGRHVAIGFVNHGFWLNRLSYLQEGRRIRNDVHPNRWEEAHPTNPVSVQEFENFCRREGIGINRRLHLRGDWETPCTFAPSWFCGYAIYDLSR